MVVRIDIAPAVLRWAIERTGIPLEHLQKINAFQKVQEWLDGTARPTLSQAEKLADRACIPFGYLLLDKPVIQPPDLPDFRTVKSQGISSISPILEELIYTCQSRLGWYSSYCLEQDEEPPKLYGRYRVTDDPIHVAQDVRDELDWNPGTRNKRLEVLQLADKVEDAGILVMRSSILGNNTHAPLDVDEFRGFTLSDNGFPLIFINSRDAYVAQYFSLAHELGHVVTAQPGLSGGYESERSVERWCNHFASEFVMPHESLRKQWFETRNLDAIVEWGRKDFGVSDAVTVWALVDEGLVKQNIAKSFLDSWERPPSNVQTAGGSFYANIEARLGKRFLSTILGALRSQEMNYFDVTRHIGFSKNETIERLSERLFEVA